MPLITLEVTPDIAAKIRFMAESGVFAIRTGNIILNCHEGSIKSIKLEQFFYPHKNPLDIKEITPILVKSV